MIGRITLWKKYGNLSSYRGLVSFYLNMGFFHLQEKEESEQAERNGESPAVCLNNDAFLFMIHKARIERFFLQNLLLNIYLNMIFGSIMPEMLS